MPVGGSLVTGGKRHKKKGTSVTHKKKSTHHKKKSTHHKKRGGAVTGGRHRGGTTTGGKRHYKKRTGTAHKKATHKKKTTHKKSSHKKSAKRGGRAASITSLRKEAKKLGIRTTTSRAGHRVYKSASALKRSIAFRKK